MKTKLLLLWLSQFLLTTIVTAEPIKRSPARASFDAGMIEQAERERSDLAASVNDRRPTSTSKNSADMTDFGDVEIQFAGARAERK